MFSPPTRSLALRFPCTNCNPFFFENPSSTFYDSRDAALSALIQRFSRPTQDPNFRKFKTASKAILNRYVLSSLPAAYIQFYKTISEASALVCDNLFICPTIVDAPIATNHYVSHLSFVGKITPRLQFFPSGFVSINRSPYHNFSTFYYACKNHLITSSMNSKYTHLDVESEYTHLDVESEYTHLDV